MMSTLRHFATNILAICLILLVSSSVLAREFEMRQSGAWNDYNTWRVDYRDAVSGEYPTESDNVKICFWNDGAAINLTGPCKANNINIDGSQNLIITGSLKATSVSTGYNAKITFHDNEIICSTLTNSGIIYFTTTNEIQIDELVNNREMNFIYRTSFTLNKVTASGTLNIGSETGIMVNGPFTNTGSINFTGNNNILKVTGDFTSNGNSNGEGHSNNFVFLGGNYKANGSCSWKDITVEFNGQKEQKLSYYNGGDLVFHNLVINNAPARKVTFDVPDNQQLSIIVNGNLDLQNGSIRIKKGEESSSCEKKITVAGDVTAAQNCWIYGKLERTMSTTGDNLFPVGNSTSPMWFTVSPSSAGQTWTLEAHNFRSSSEPFYGCLENRYWEVTTSGSGKVGGQFSSYNDVNKIITLWHCENNSWSEVSGDLETATFSSYEIAKQKSTSTNITPQLVSFGVKNAYRDQVANATPVQTNAFVWTARGNLNPYNQYETWKDPNNWIKPSNLPAEHVQYPTADDDVVISNQFVLGDITVDGQTFSISGGFYYKKTDVEQGNYGNIKFPTLKNDSECRNMVLSENATIILLNGGLTIRGDLKADGLIKGNSKNLTFTSSSKQTITSASATKENPLSLIINGCNTIIDNPNGVDIAENINLDLSWSSLALNSGILKVCGSDNYVSTPTISGNYNSTCYVDGGLKLTNSTFYPVGNNGYYCPITVSGQNHIVKYVNGRVATKSYSGQADDTYPKLNAEYWSIIPSSADSWLTVNVGKDMNGNTPTNIAYLTSILSTTWKTTGNNNNVNLQNYSYAGKTYGSFIATYNEVAITFNWTGATDDQWNTATNWSGGRTPIGNSDVVITNATTLPVIDNIETAANSITINDGATLTVKNGAALMVMTTIKSVGTGHLVINNSWDNMCNVRTSRGLKKGDGTADASNTVVKTTLQPHRFNYIGSATKEGSIDLSGLKAGSKFHLYDVMNDRWDNLALNTATFGSNYNKAGRVGSGSDPFVVSQTGTVMTNGSFTYNVRANIDPSDNAYYWDLLSNPFMYTFPLEAIDYENIDPVLWFRAHNGTNFYCTTTSLVAGLSVPKTQEPVLSMAPMQTFSVRPYSEGTATITFNGNKASTIYKNSKLKSAPTEKDVLRLTISSDGKNTDETALVFRNIGSFDYILGDAEKMATPSTDNAIYLTKGDKNMAIGIYPEFTQFNNESIPLGISLASGTEYGTITAANIDEIDSNVDIILLDNELNNEVDLRSQNIYEFEDFSNGNIDNRFEIKILPRTADADGNNATCIKSKTSGISISRIAHNEISVKFGQVSGDKSSKITIYDTSGHAVIRQETKDAPQSIVNLGNAKGIYIVEVTTGSSTEKQKIRIF